MCFLLTNWFIWTWLTRTCHTFSLAPSKLQKRTLAPSRPCPPHMLLGVTSSSRTRWVFELYTSSLTDFSTLAFRRSFSKSLSLFWRNGDISHNPAVTCTETENQITCWRTWNEIKSADHMATLCSPEAIIQVRSHFTVRCPIGFAVSRTWHRRTHVTK